jgi:hypothetical protein
MMNEGKTMTKFERSGFQYHAGYLTYKGHFIARFKYRGAIKKSDYIKILCKHYTLEDWTAKLKTNPPLMILRNDGFVGYTAFEGFKVA